MNYETIELSQQGPIARIMLNRPEKLNAINHAMLTELDTALDEIEQDDRILALVLNGNGRAFCAGFDLSAGMETNRKGVNDWRPALQYDLDIIMRFWRLSKPTIAAVHGYVLAAGFELALACDLTVCDEETLFGEPELRFGSSIVALLLPWYTNPKRTKKLLLSGQDRLPAEEALQMGIVNEIADPGKVLDRGIALAREIALMDPDSVRLTKQAINRTYEIMGMNQALDMGVDTAVQIESIETALRREFNRVHREKGLKAALKWREDRLEK
ncbi:MAG: enoyl-CoA hydratase/isomerase family protein [Gammaproteobacteria bacterium]|nr:enoyl-CoA hydratase/isomerase family protein [Gammaproteobacteria bacterium]